MLRRGQGRGLGAKSQPPGRRTVRKADATSGHEDPPGTLRHKRDMVKASLRRIVFAVIALAMALQGGVHAQLAAPATAAGPADDAVQHIRHGVFWAFCGPGGAALSPSDAPGPERGHEHCPFCTLTGAALAATPIASLTSVRFPALVMRFADAGRTLVNPARGPPLGARGPPVSR